MSQTEKIQISLQHLNSGTVINSPLLSVAESSHIIEEMDDLRCHSVSCIEFPHETIDEGREKVLLGYEVFSEMVVLIRSVTVNIVD